MKIPKIDTKPFQLYLDLDGVFADFEKKVKELSGFTPTELKSRGKGLWKFIMDDKQFFASLEFMPDAEYLWEYTKQYDPIFLTGAPPGERFQQQKRDWVSSKFGAQYETIVLPKKDKQLHSGTGKVLVDDTHSNIEQWISAGGDGILHQKDVHQTIENVEILRLSRYGK